MFLIINLRTLLNITENLSNIYTFRSIGCEEQSEKSVVYKHYVGMVKRYRDKFKKRQIMRKDLFKLETKAAINTSTLIQFEDFINF